MIIKSIIKLLVDSWGLVVQTVKDFFNPYPINSTTCRYLGLRSDPPFCDCDLNECKFIEKRHENNTD